MIAPSNSWPPSQALTFIVMSRLTASTRARRAGGNSRSSDARSWSASTSR